MIEREIIEKGIPSRYDLSFYTFRQLQRDHIRFEQQYVNKFPNNFICRILINYMCYVQENDLEKFEKDITDLCEKKSYKEYYYDSRISFTASLTEKIQEFDFVNNDNFKKRTVITYILDKFAAMSISVREKIYFLFQYKAITAAIEKNEILLLKNTDGIDYEVKAYDIAVDDNSFSYYLMGYSRQKGSDKDFEYHSFKLSRIAECRSKHREFTLSYKERKNAKDIYDKFGAAYIARNLSAKQIEKSVVRLTKIGYETLFLKIISHQRPIPISDPTSVLLEGNRYYDLEFDCSYLQIRNYFFSFGPEAEIIRPEWLREWFFSNYQNALKKYQA